MTAAVIVGGTRDTADERVADRLKFCGYDPIHQVPNQPVPDDDFFDELFGWVDANGGPSKVVAFVCEVGSGNTEVQNRLDGYGVRTCGFADFAGIVKCVQQLGSPGVNGLEGSDDTDQPDRNVGSHATDAGASEASHGSASPVPDEGGTDRASLTTDAVAGIGGGVVAGSLVGWGAAGVAAAGTAVALPLAGAVAAGGLIAVGGVTVARRLGVPVDEAAHAAGRAAVTAAHAAGPAAATAAKASKAAATSAARAAAPAASTAAKATRAAATGAARRLRSLADKIESP